MSNALLSWDDFEEDENPAIAQAAKNIKNIDTTEADREMDKKQKSIEHSKALQASGLAPTGTAATPILNPGANYTPQQLKEMNSDRLTKARLIIAEMDKHLESGGRVNVAEKYILNCQADLNQLVPFKYDTAWLLYLTSCENHWMPGELGLDKAAAEFNQIKKGTSRKLMVRWYANYKYREAMFNGEALLNIYRLVTNPECRQYILRQAFELCTIRHTMDEIVELFDPLNYEMKTSTGQVTMTSKGQWEIDSYSFKNRYKLARELTPMKNDFTFSTMGLENTSAFIEQFVYLYGYVNWTMNIVPTYQLMNNLRMEGKGEGLITMMTKLMKDVQAQTKFATTIISFMLDENPQVDTPELRARIRSNFDRFISAEEDLASTLANTDTEYNDVIQLVGKYVGDFLSQSGLGETVSGKVNQNNQWFVDLINSQQPKLSGEASLSGSGGNGSLGEW